MPCLYLLPINTIPKIGITSVSGTSSLIVDSKYNESLREHLQEAGLVVQAVVPCDRRILGFNWEGNEMVPIIDPSLEKTSEVWIRLDDPNCKAGQVVGSWFAKNYSAPC